MIDYFAGNSFLQEIVEYSRSGLIDKSSLPSFNLIFLVPSFLSLSRRCLIASLFFKDSRLDRSDSIRNKLFQALGARNSCIRYVQSRARAGWKPSIKHEWSVKTYKTSIKSFTAQAKADLGGRIPFYSLPVPSTGKLPPINFLLIRFRRSLILHLCRMSFRTFRKYLFLIQNLMNRIFLRSLYRGVRLIWVLQLR